MAKRKVMRMPNSYGSIKKLSGNRRKPFMACVNPRINDKGTYSYDILGYFEDRAAAMIALAEYNKNPYDLSGRNTTFAEVYEAYFKDKYAGTKKFSAQSMRATKAAFNNCSVLHNKIFSALKYSDLQRVIDECPLKHSSLEIIVTLFKQMYKFAMREEIVQKDASAYIKINIADDDEHGIRWSDEDVAKLWANTDNIYARIILIYLYTGWRATELLELPKSDINLDEWYMIGGKKTKAGKDRIVPIHPRIRSFVKEFYDAPGDYLLSENSKPRSYAFLLSRAKKAFSVFGIATAYTIHDCRHTFSSWLSDADVPTVICDRLMGHAGKTLDEKVYIHKTFEQLREAIEKIP